ncbi:MAG TPA: hypothetical protein VF559_13110 [Caulobacteraceae bacterium]|jgi:hypothetical protein
MDVDYSSQPKLIVWTLRRTGGTTLQRILQLAYQEGRVYAEPFNWDRAFGPYSKRLARGGSAAEFYASLLPELDRPLVIKHCVELMQRKVNAALFSVSLLQEFRHVILYRKDELARMRSLVIAESTGFWGQSRVDAYDDYLGKHPQIIKPYDEAKTLRVVDFGIEQLRAIRTALKELKIGFTELRLEELYADGPEAAYDTLEKELTKLGVSLAGIRRNAVLGKLQRGEQGSSALLKHVPSAPDFRVLGERYPHLKNIAPIITGKAPLPTPLATAGDLS